MKNSRPLPSQTAALAVVGGKSGGGYFKRSVNVNVNVNSALSHSASNAVNAPNTAEASAS